jgi:5-oxoprolinase (ATP-hydrolysing)
MIADRSFEISIDTGGTFTDLIASDSDGNNYRRKILSSGSIRGTIIQRNDAKSFYIKENWKLTRDFLSGFSFSILSGGQSFESTVEVYDPEACLLQIREPIPEALFRAGLSFELTTGEEAPVLAARMTTETGLEEAFPLINMRLGSTKGTNALLEKKGAPTVLFITKGFKDLLEIGTQQRPHIFQLNITKSKPLPQEIIEIDERIDADGNVLKSLQVDMYAGLIAELKQTGIESAAVAFLHAYKNPAHELLFKGLLEKHGIKFISVSAELSPLIKILERTASTAVNAYLSPIIDRYLYGVSGAINSSILVMNSAGGLIHAEAFYAKDSLLSGPAGGVVGAAAIGSKAGITRLITFDMGGTSTDVSRYNNGYDYTYALQIGDAQVFSPAIAIETVAAGGGSVCTFDGFKLTVGPESAGAEPGPACYGAGGPLALTDVNLLLGRMDIGSFGIPVNVADADEKLDELIGQINTQTGKQHTKEQVLGGFMEIASEIMAGAIKKISTSNGFDPAEYTLLAFGGAGGMHACGIAGLLNITSILIPEDAGLLSAYGISTASIERFAEKQVLKTVDEFFDVAEDNYHSMIEEASRKLQGDLSGKVEAKVDLLEVSMRFLGQDSILGVEWSGSKKQLIDDFRKKYTALFGHWVEDRTIEVESMRVKVSVVKRDIETEPERAKSVVFATPEHHIRSWDGYNWTDAPVFMRADLVQGQEITGFAIITDDKSTTVVEKGWRVTVDPKGNLLMNLEDTQQFEPAKADQSQETKLELFTNRFMSVAANMGAILQRTALSVNIKERLDFSCALLDADGFLVANAPHIPVHLGGLGMCVRTLLEQFTFEAGDAVVTNHPFYGGSHLPDVTLITPVFYQGERVAFVVNRAHHAEIGGISPGSMPPSATNLAEEGVTIAPFYLVKKGIPNWSGMKSILEDAPYPSRLVDENLADLNAALAANLEGVAVFSGLIELYGKDEVMHYLAMLRRYATDKIRSVLSGIADGKYQAEELLDDGTQIKVSITIKGENIVFDFSGSGDVHPKNMNATPAIVNSVVIYVMRLLVDEEIPLNDGLMDPVEIILPEGFLNPPFDREPQDCPAVVGGNVEVSQRLTDTLLKALGLAACSQGTMNNILFGNDSFGYYETICGGTGATSGHHGASAVHQHMTNTRITDAEVLEHRFPVRLNRFEIRKGSGGKGQYSGGDGTIRDYTFLDDMELSILSQHRKQQPYGFEGGQTGATGRQWVIRQDESKEELKGVDHVHLQKGDKFVVETPGGGGFGLASDDR